MGEGERAGANDTNGYTGYIRYNASLFEKGLPVTAQRSEVAKIADAAS